MMSPIGITKAGYDMDSGYVYAKFITAWIPGTQHYEILVRAPETR